MSLNERANSMLDDIIAARAPGMNDLTRLVLKMMVMDVLYANARRILREEHPELDSTFSAWSVELASRTQAMMDTHGMTKVKQKVLGETAKKLAEELMTRFADRVLVKH